MDYAKHYDRLIERSRNRVLIGYSERHHVIPRCMGGTNDKGNIVSLTPEEHYVAHLLLTRIYRGNHRVLWAAVMMAGGNENQNGRSVNKVRGWMRRKFAEEMKRRGIGRKHTKESREKMSRARRGVARGPYRDGHGEKISNALRGKKKSDAHRAALSAAKKGKPGRRLTEETKKKLSRVIKEAVRKSEKYQAVVAYRATEEYQRAQSQRMAAWWAARKLAAMNQPSEA